MEAAGKIAAKKLLGEHMNKKKEKKVCGNDDPFFELVPSRSGKMKKVKRRIPDYIPDHDAEILAKVRSRAYHLDMSLFNFMGMRFGWSSVIGLIPEIGDVLDILMAWNLYRTIIKVDCPLVDDKLKSRMRRNIYLDFVIGLLPIIGDLMDAAYKCNTKNAVLLSEALDKAYAVDKNGRELDEISRKRASRELFSSDPDFVYGQAPPVYEHYEQAPKPKQSWWDWALGRTEESRQIDSEKARNRQRF